MSRTKKVHIPGPINDAGIQHCTRCHTKVFDRREWSESCTGWSGPILSSRSGAVLVTEPEATKYRQCGRALKPTPNPAICDECKFSADVHSIGCSQHHAAGASVSA